MHNAYISLNNVNYYRNVKKIIKKKPTCQPLNYEYSRLTVYSSRCLCNDIQMLIMSMVMLQKDFLYFFHYEKNNRCHKQNCNIFNQMLPNDMWKQQQQ